MIVIRKEKILFVISCFVFSIFAFYLFKDIKEEPVKETVSLPVSNKVIVIDARTWNSRRRSSKLKWNNRSGNQLKNSI